MAVSTSRCVLYFLRRWWRLLLLLLLLLLLELLVKVDLYSSVVAAAVVFPHGKWGEIIKVGLDDSKKLSPNRRRYFFDIIHKNSDVGIGFSSVQEIDKINILQATFLAMNRALENLHIAPDYTLIDGDKVPTGRFPAEAIVKGDACSISIAAASILAKVYRDEIMLKYSKQFPEYGFQTNSGYGTKEHLSALKNYGITPIHRKSFKPVHNILN